jgi:hypothetical protein
MQVHSPVRGLYELHMTWGLRRASRPQPERGYCDGGRELFHTDMNISIAL